MGRTITGIPYNIYVKEVIMKAKFKIGDFVKIDIINMNKTGHEWPHTNTDMINLAKEKKIYKINHVSMNVHNNLFFYMLGAVDSNDSIQYIWSEKWLSPCRFIQEGGNIINKSKIS